MNAGTSRTVGGLTRPALLQISQDAVSARRPAVETQPHPDRPAAGGIEMAETRPDDAQSRSGRRRISAAWARQWLSGAREEEIRLLRAVLVRFGSLPFELEVVSAALGEAGGMSGAAARVAAAGLVQSGVLFAVRQAWGERLLGVPADTVAIWQPLLLPAGTACLTAEEAIGVRAAEPSARLSLAMELWTMLLAIGERELQLTKSGRLSKPSLVRLAAATRLSAEELVRLQAEHGDAAPSATAGEALLALALRCGWLVGRDGKIRIEERRFCRFFACTPGQADMELSRFVAERLLSSRPGMQLSVSAVRALPKPSWVFQAELEAVSANAAAVEETLVLMAALGWVERGHAEGRKVFRSLLAPARRDGGENGSEEAVFVLPDGEIVIPPGAGFAVRYALHQLAELKSADKLFVYRLSSRGCEQAYRQGLSRDAATALLERISDGPLPDAAIDALTDGFACAAKASPAVPVGISFVLEQAINAIMGRTASGARTPFEDDSEEGGDPVGLSLAEESTVVGPAGGIQHVAESAAVAPIDGTERAEIDAIELFPGFRDIPSAWLLSPRAYHLSTRKELVRQAIAWQTELLIRLDGGLQVFLPLRLADEGAGWSVAGRWSAEAGGTPKPAVLGHVDIGELMIRLPEGAGTQSI